MSFLKNNKTAALVLGGSALALTAGVVMYLKSKKSEKVIVSDIKEELGQEITTKIDEEEEDHDRVKRGAHNNNMAKLQEAQFAEEQHLQNQQQDRDQELSVKTKTSIASSRVKVQFLDGSDSYDFATITAILESSLDYIGQEYIAYTQKNREDRRKVRTNDSDRYKELVLEYNAQIEKFILTAQDQLLADVNIDKEQFEKSINSLIQNGYYQQLYMVQSAMRQKISEKLPRNKQVSKEQIKEIIQYQLDILVNQKETFLAMISQLQFVPDIAELIPFVLNTMIQDMIFDKFGIEEEDQTSQMSAQDLIDDPDMHSLLKQIEEAMLNMMNSLGLNYIDEEQEIEEIERLREMGQYSEN